MVADAAEIGGGWVRRWGCGGQGVGSCTARFRGREVRERSPEVGGGAATCPEVGGPPSSAAPPGPPGPWKGAFSV